MDSKLFLQAVTKFLGGLLLVGLLLFVPAGTFIRSSIACRLRVVNSDGILSRFRVLLPG